MMRWEWVYYRRGWHFDAWHPLSMGGFFYGVYEVRTALLMIMATDNGAGRVLTSYIERRGLVVVPAVATW
jgi:hypothetical protein